MHHDVYPFVFPMNAPDIWDFWFILKTFGPGAIAGSIAILAVIIALTQRRIAANKYSLDMFDKRYELYEKLNIFYDSYQIINITHSDGYSYNNFVPELKSIFLRSSFLFHGLDKNALMKIIGKPINETQEKFVELIKKWYELQNEENRINMTLKASPTTSAGVKISPSPLIEKDHFNGCIDEIKIKRKELLLEIENNHRQFMNKISAIIKEMERELSVAHKPY